MGSFGDAYDDALGESFFATLECELLARRRCRSQANARMAVFSYVEGFCNPLRLHSALRYRSPVIYEQEYRPALSPHSPASLKTVHQTRANPVETVPGRHRATVGADKD